MEILNAVFGNLGNRKKQQEFEQVRDRITTDSEDDHLVAGGEKAEDAEPGAARGTKENQAQPCLRELGAHWGTWTRAGQPREKRTT